LVDGHFWVDVKHEPGPLDDFCDLFVGVNLPMANRELVVLQNEMTHLLF
jgi:hypothetical protein